ncbi:MAG: GHKL domain-containing protein [Mobilitalea sp.]
MEISLIGYHTISCLLDLFKEFLVIHYIIGFQKKKNNKMKYFAVLLVPISITLLMVVIPGEYISILYLPIILAVLQIVSGIWHVKSFLLSIISYVCICEIDYFNGAILQLLPNNQNNFMGTNSILISVITLVVIFVIACLCKHFDITFFKKSFGCKKAFVIIEVAVLFLNIGIMGVFFGVLSESQIGSYGYVLLSAVIVLSMMLSVITLIFYSVIMNVKEYKVINDMNQQQLIMQKEHYYKLREIDKETRKFRHDIQNHIIVLAKLLKEENLEQVKNYLQDISLHIENIKPIINCGSEIVDAILNEKYDRCKEKNISLNVKGIIHAPMTIDDYDICTILANAVDNAIEACTRFKDGEKWITISIGIHQNYINFIITNPISEEVNLRTRKKDIKNHGFGLQNLKECVLKNYGEIKINAENGEFILDILVKAF